MSLNALPITFIGAGNMASHMLSGLQRAGFPTNAILVTDTDPEKLQAITEQFAVQTTTDNRAAIQQAAIVILAIKPQSMHSFAIQNSTAFAHSPLVISIAAGIPLEKLHQFFGAIPIVRAMPNICVSIAEGNTIFFAPQLEVSLHKVADAFFSLMGITQWVLDEEQLDAYTVLTGAGPGYVFFILQSIIDAAQTLGISEADAKKAVLQLFSGATQLASLSSSSLRTLQQQVTSKKGVTEQVIETLNKGHMSALFALAFEKAYARGQQLQHLMEDELKNKE